MWKYHSTSQNTQNLKQTKSIFEFKEVYLQDLLKILKELKTSKSAGYYNIPASLIKDGAEEIAAPPIHLINASLRESVFPTSEKCAKITPVYKSGERSKMDNYRPISVLPVLSKQIYEYLETNKLLSPNQFGFRRSRSTQHAVTYFSDYVRKHMDDGEYTGAVFVDLKKAFDTVDHGRLLSKLPSYGIKGKELSWFESYLFDRNSLYLWKIPLQKGNLLYAVCHRDQYLDRYCLYS